MIKFKIKLFLHSFLQDQVVSAEYQNQIIEFKGNEEKEVELELSLNENTDRLKLIEFTQFKPSPNNHIKIKQVLINEYEEKDFYQYFSFDMKNNLYVENNNIQEIGQINFNGTLCLEVMKNKDRFTWFETTFYKNKKGLVYKNDILNCDNEYGCWYGGNCHHSPPWQRFDFDQHIGKKEYDFVTLGCSITAGTAIKKEESWPRIISQDKTLLNLGVPGGGIDQVFLNVKELMRRKIKCSKMIILLPSLGRKLVRVFRHDYYFNLILNVNHLINENFNIYFTKKELEDIRQKYIKDMILNDFKKREKKIINRLVKMLEDNCIDFYISSWSNETYKLLKTIVKKENLLPLFNENKDTSVGLDGSHPSEKIHKIWAKQIKSQISH